jgi:hypothetical protein
MKWGIRQEQRLITYESYKLLRDIRAAEISCQEEDVPLANRFQNFGRDVRECAPVQFYLPGITTLAATKD